jgi:hypothetical protein
MSAISFLVDAARDKSYCTFYPRASSFTSQNKPILKRSISYKYISAKKASFWRFLVSKPTPQPTVHTTKRHQSVNPSIEALKSPPGLPDKAPPPPYHLEVPPPTYNNVPRTNCPSQTTNHLVFDVENGPGTNVTLPRRKKEGGCCGNCCCI